MVSQPKSGQKKRLEQWAGSEVGTAAETDVPPNQEVRETEMSPVGGEEGSRPNQSEEEEKRFVASLYGFMKDRGTAIERIPHLGFKQINLWRIYKAVEKLGGYDSVTARRLWKNVYDELGGSPGSTSAATCTRRHYERLVLPFERQLRGEEDKPLPPAKPRKQYKKSLEGKSGKAEGKRKRSQQEVGGEGHAEAQEKPAEGSRVSNETARPESEAPRAKDQPASDCPAPRLAESLFAGVRSSGGGVISPLEKKKRTAQASLGLSQASSGPDRDGRGRASVIHRAQSPGKPHSGRTRESSEGSPVPHSSSSSRSPSPCSVSSDDYPELPRDRPLAPGPVPLAPPAYVGNFTSVPYGGGVCKPVSCYPGVKDRPSHLNHHGDLRQLSPFATDPARATGRTPDWNPGCRGEDGHPVAKTHQPVSSTSAGTGPKACWVPPLSSFTKVLPKAGAHLRPVPFQQGHKHPRGQKRPPPEDTPAYGKKLQMVPPLHRREAQESSKPGLPKPLPTQHSGPLHPQAGFPLSYILPGCGRVGPVSAHQLKGLSLHPFIPAHLALPSQPSSVYRHIPAGTLFSFPYEAFPRPRPSQIPVWHPHAGYATASLNSHYPHTKL